MDVKEIIRYLFSLRDRYNIKINYLVLVLCLTCIVNVRTCSADSIPRDSGVISADNLQTVNVSDVSGHRSLSIGDKLLLVMETAADYLHRQMDDSAGTEVARTFGRPLRKLQSALLPIMFKLGVMSTLIFLTFLLVLKGVGIGLLLLMFKMGAAFAKFKTEWHGHHSGHHDGWPPYHKEVHLHVVGHPGHGHGYEAAFHGGHEPWSRTDLTTGPGYNRIAPLYYGYQQGSNSLNTPYGHYVRTGDPTAPASI